MYFQYSYIDVLVRSMSFHGSAAVLCLRFFYSHFEHFLNISYSPASDQRCCIVSVKVIAVLRSVSVIAGCAILARLVGNSFHARVAYKSH